MIIVDRISQLPNGAPVPAGTEVKLRREIDGTVLDTALTDIHGWVTFQHNGSPGPVYTEVSVGGETRYRHGRAVAQVGSWYEGEWAAFMEMVQAGVIMHPNATALKVVPGTGLQIRISPGAAIVEGILGRYYEYEDMAIASNGSGQPRYDVVVLQLHVGGSQVGKVEAIIVQGTPAANPVLPLIPSLPNVAQLILANVRVQSGASTILESDIVDRRPAASFVPDGSITSNKLPDGAVITSKLAAKAVTSDKIADNAVTSVQIAPNTITGDDIAGSSIGSWHIADNSIELADLSGGAQSALGRTLVANRTGVGGSWDKTTGQLAFGHGLSVSKGDNDGASWIDVYPNWDVIAAKSHTHNLNELPGLIQQWNIADGAVTSDKIADGSIQESDLSAGVTAKLNGVNPPVIAVTRNVTKTNFSTGGTLITESRWLEPGTYAWFAIGTIRVTGEASGVAPKGWLKLMRDGSETNGEPFYTTADGYGISAEVMGGGSFVVSSARSIPFALEWGRDQGTITANSRQIFVWTQKVA